MFILVRNALTIAVATALLAGCGGSQPPTAAPREMPQSLAITTHADRGESWMLPEAKSKDLLYVGDLYDVTVYSYPQGKLEGKLTGFYEIGGSCVDKKGDVFVVNAGGAKIIEYRHGDKTPIRTLDSPESNPTGCAIDPSTGNLALAIYGPISGGELAVFPHAQGSPAIYTDPDIFNYNYCGYDNKGDLFVDGNDNANRFAFAELPKSGGALADIAVDQSFGEAGGIQWDGKYLSVGDATVPNIYRFNISGSEGTEVGTTTVGSSARNLHQFFIQDHKVIAPNLYLIGYQAASDVLITPYPAGGSALKTITKDVKASTTAVMSKAQK